MTVLKIELPGAAMSTLSTPKFEKLERSSL
jgi:hypothetical protein